MIHLFRCCYSNQDSVKGHIGCTGSCFSWLLPGMCCQGCMRAVPGRRRKHANAVTRGPQDVPGCHAEQCWMPVYSCAGAAESTTLARSCVSGRASAIVFDSGLQRYVCIDISEAAGPCTVVCLWEQYLQAKPWHAAKALGGEPCCFQSADPRLRVSRDAGVRSTGAHLKQGIIAHTTSPESA